MVASGCIVRGGLAPDNALKVGSRCAVKRLLAEEAWLSHLRRASIAISFFALVAVFWFMTFQVYADLCCGWSSKAIPSHSSQLNLGSEFVRRFSIRR